VTLELKVQVSTVATGLPATSGQPVRADQGPFPMTSGSGGSDGNGPPFAHGWLQRVHCRGRFVNGLVRSTARPRVPRLIPVLAGIGVLLFLAALGIAWGGRAMGVWGPGAGQATLPPAAAWRSVESVNGGFSIEFPGEAKPLSSDEQGLSMSGLFLATSTGTLTVMWADVPAVRADYGPAMAQGRATRMSATIVSQGDVEVGGLPGYQFVLAVSKCGPSFPGPCRVTWQVLPSGSRLYQLLTAAPDPPGTNPMSDRFFKSFKLRS